MFRSRINNLDNEHEYWQGDFKTSIEASQWLVEISNWISNTVKVSRIETIGPIDLSQDEEYQKKERIEKIKKEAPNLEEKIDALIASSRGDNSKLIEVIQKIEALEIKYPEPIKEGK